MGCALGLHAAAVHATAPTCGATRGPKQPSAPPPLSLPHWRSHRALTGRAAGGCRPQRTGPPDGPLPSPPRLHGHSQTYFDTSAFRSQRLWRLPGFLLRLHSAASAACALHASTMSNTSNFSQKCCYMHSAKLRQPDALVTSV